MVMLNHTVPSTEIFWAQSSGREHAAWLLIVEHYPSYRTKVCVTEDSSLQRAVFTKPVPAHTVSLPAYRFPSGLQCSGHFIRSQSYYTGYKLLLFYFDRLVLREYI